MEKSLRMSVRTERTALAGESLQSAVMDFLRMPMVILVLYAHVLPIFVGLGEAKFPLLSVKGVCNLVTLALSNVIANVTVPTFFFISGFLFFANFREFSWDGYKRKLRSRVRTLLVPYLAWNIGAFVVMSVATGVYAGDLGLVLESLGNFNASILWNYVPINSTELWWGANWSLATPYVLPLWFVRDLMVVCLLSPVVFWLVKHLGGWAIALLFLLYEARLWEPFSGMSAYGMLFFTAGAYFAIKGIDPCGFSVKWRAVILPVASVAFVGMLIMYDTYSLAFMILEPAWLCIAVLAFFCMASMILIRTGFQQFSSYASVCFFIYALHYAPLLPRFGSMLWLVNSMLWHTIPGDSQLRDLAVYMLTPIVMTVIGMVIFVVIRKTLPKLAWLLSGCR